LLIEIIDLGINNLSSLSRAVDNASSDLHKIKIISHSKESKNPDLLFLPGVGKFSKAMSTLTDFEFDKLLRDEIDKGTKLVGICLGMQLFFSSSEESPDAQGLDLIPGEVRKLPSVDRVPNVGWAAVSQTKDVEAFSSLGLLKDFYFVHSYYAQPKIENDILTYSSTGSFNYVSSIRHENILGFQFHPEKSGTVGRQLLSETLTWGRNT
jgi:imidazole glycerol-phosphate synthase subunit HisH